MRVGNEAVVAGSVVAVVVVLLSLAVVDSRMLPAASSGRSVLISLACAVTGSLAWLVFAPIGAPAAVGPLFAPVTALAAVAAYLATIVVRSSGANVVITIAFGFAWSTLVFVPTAIVTFTPYAVDWPIALQPVDHGGSLALNVSSGAAALGVLLAGGRRVKSAPIGLKRGVTAMVALSVGWLAWLAGAELAIDDVTPIILINGLVGALGGMVGWLVVQRISHLSTTWPAVAAGLVSGLVAVTSGASLFTPVSAAATGIIAGGAACIFTLRRVGASRRQQWFIVGSHLIAGAVGIVLLGLLATSMGFLFTGSTRLIQNQVVGTLVIASYSSTVSFLLWQVLRRLPGATTAPVAERVPLRR